jgi:hypothetical protein
MVDGARGTALMLRDCTSTLQSAAEIKVEGASSACPEHLCKVFVYGHGHRVSNAFP